MIEAIFHIAAVERDLKLVDRATERATMWGLREASRKLRADAKRNAPVYRGAGAVKALRKGALGPRQAGPETGLLKRSIAGSRRLKKHGDGVYSLTSGPRGERVHLYAAKAEAKHHFMAQANASVGPQANAVFARAWGRAIHSVHR